MAEIYENKLLYFKSKQDTSKNGSWTIQFVSVLSAMAKYGTEQLEIDSIWCANILTGVHLIYYIKQVSYYLFESYISGQNLA